MTWGPDDHGCRLGCGALFADRRECRAHEETCAGEVEPVRVPAALPIRRIICTTHPGGPFVLQPGVEPAARGECAMCQRLRMERERRVMVRKCTAWQTRRARTAAELRAAGDPFGKLKGRT